MSLFTSTLGKLMPKKQGVKIPLEEWLPMSPSKMVATDIESFQLYPISNDLNVFIIDHDGAIPKESRMIKHPSLGKLGFKGVLTFTSNKNFIGNLTSPILQAKNAYKSVVKHTPTCGKALFPFAVSTFTPYPAEMRVKDIKYLDKTQKKHLEKEYDPLQFLSLFCEHCDSGEIYYWQYTGVAMKAEITPIANNVSEFIQKLV